METQVTIKMTLEEYDEQQRKQREEIQSLIEKANKLQDKVHMYREILLSPMEESLSKNKEIHNSSYEKLIYAIINGKIKLTAYFAEDELAGKTSIVLRADAYKMELDAIKEEDE